MIQENKCPNCGSHNIKQADNLIYTSNPPQLKMRCLDCGSDFMVSVKQSSSQGCPNNTLGDTQNAHNATNFQSLNTIFQSQGFGVGYVGNTAPGFGQQGWVCPRCGNIMSPNQPYCLFCYKQPNSAI